MATKKEVIKEAVNGDEGAAPTFSKSQIVKSKRYSARRDALNALLEDSQMYSISEVDNLLKHFYEGGNE